MSSLQTLLKRLTVDVSNNLSYVYYNKENGKIHKISGRNIPQEGLEVFEVNTNEVKPILAGKRKTEEFTITYDVSLKQVRLKEVAYDDTHKTAATMCYQLPVIKNSNDSHIMLEHVYEGVDVYVYDTECEYSKDQCVWYNNNVYKLATDISADTEFDLTVHKLFVEDVLITDLPTQNQTTEKLTMQPEYMGIHIDVWYKELSHLAGQHVWLNGVVYKLLKDQDANTEFTMDNAEKIVGNVKLYADENKDLETVKNVVSGDMLLDNNQLYSVQLIAEKFDKDKISIFFFNSASTIIIYYNNENVIKADLSSIDETIVYKDLKLDLIKTADLKNGQTILSGKCLYQVQVDREYDIIVQQNTQNKTWSMIINPYIKKFLQTSGYRPTETLYFSVTSKYDPNILYRSLEFTVSDLLSEKTSIIPFTTKLEQDSTDVSIYTAKYYDSYAHEVI
jgi:hypothetical protein